MILETVCGTEFTIDDEDAKRFAGVRFHLNGNYIYIYWPVAIRGDRPKREPLHVAIMAPPNYKYQVIEVDHEDGNGLNNTRNNLRVVTKSEQNFNRAAWGDYPQGITFVEKTQSYRARVKVNGKDLHLGYYSQLDDAIAARKKYDEENGIVSGGI